MISVAATSLLMALSARHADTGSHSSRVNVLSLSLGRTLQLSGDELHVLKFGSLLHDIGKLQTPDAILTKADALNENEWSAMRRHPVTGANILRSLNFPEPICLAVEQHHERWDGAGYPYGSSGLQISQSARIIAVADTYDAITRDRAYRKGECHQVALHEIQSSAGTQFDPQVVDTFARVYPATFPFKELHEQSTTHQNTRGLGA